MTNIATPRIKIFYTHESSFHLCSKHTAKFSSNFSPKVQNFASHLVLLQKIQELIFEYSKDSFWDLYINAENVEILNHDDETDSGINNKIIISLNSSPELKALTKDFFDMAHQTWEKFSKKLCCQTINNTPSSTEETKSEKQSSDIISETTSDENAEGKIDQVDVQLFSPSIDQVDIQMTPSIDEVSVQVPPRIDEVSVQTNLGCLDQTPAQIIIPKSPAPESHDAKHKEPPANKDSSKPNPSPPLTYKPNPSQSPIPYLPIGNQDPESSEDLCNFQEKKERSDRPLSMPSDFDLIQEKDRNFTSAYIKWIKLNEKAFYLSYLKLCRNAPSFAAHNTAIILSHHWRSFIRLSITLQSKSIEKNIHSFSSSLKRESHPLIIFYTNLKPLEDKKINEFKQESSEKNPLKKTISDEAKHVLKRQKMGIKTFKEKATCQKLLCEKTDIYKRVEYNLPIAWKTLLTKAWNSIEKIALLL